MNKELFNNWYEQELYSAGKCCDECHQKFMNVERYVKMAFEAGYQAAQGEGKYSKELAEVERGEV